MHLHRFRRCLYSAAAALVASLVLTTPALTAPLAGRNRTTLAISRESFLINGQPTYPRRVWNGHKIEGLLFNARLVQGIFDDRNPETLRLWAYPDSERWDAERNTSEFVAAMPEW